MLTPGQQARQSIDKQSSQAGWIVLNIEHFNPFTSSVNSIRQFATESVFADNLKHMSKDEILLIKLPRKQTQIVQEKEKRFSQADNHEKTIDENLVKSESLSQSILKQEF